MVIIRNIIHIGKKKLLPFPQSRIALHPKKLKNILSKTFERKKINSNGKKNY